MTIPAVGFTNPRTHTRAFLDSALAQPVGTTFPTATQLGSKTTPLPGYVQVAWDGTPTSRYPATLYATIRVTCWHWNPTPAEDMALNDVLLAMATHAGGDAGVWTVLHLTGPLSGADPDSGYAFAYCTFRVSPRPITT